MNAAPPARRPNLLFVFADQMRFCDMGCAGNPDVHTPVLDRFAAEGTRLTHCFATSPVCGPNRAVLLTGTYPTTNRVPGNDLALPEGMPTFGTIAAQSGCRTGYIGKWHLDGIPRTCFTPPGPRRFGFDFWAAYNCSHDYFRPRWYRDTDELIEADGYEPERQTDIALEFLAEHGASGSRRAEPFCLFLSWGPPHDPYPQVPDVYRERYDPQALTLRPNMKPDAANPLARRLEPRRTLADYYAAITALDAQFGRLLEHLDRQGLSGNTVVVFTSDHGDMLWSHGWMKKQAPYDESARVPFLIRGPGLPNGRIDDLLIGTVDLLPTLAGLCGWQVTPEGIEGKDLSALLRGGEGDRPESVLLANYVAGDEAAHQGMPEWRAIRTHRHTYIERPRRQPWLLFDNEADPYQVNNLLESRAADSAGRPPDVAAALRADLGKWLERTHDPALPGPELLAHMGLADAWEARERHFGHR